MNYNVISAPAEEPLTLEEVKAHLRTLPGANDEDATILRPLIVAAREYCEGITGRSIGEQVVQAYPAQATGLIRLPRSPIIEIVAVRYALADGGIELIPPSAYQLTAAGEILILPTPTGALRQVEPVEIEYRAGYMELPYLMRQAMLLLIGHWYTNREAVATGAVTTVEVGMTTRTLLRQYKDWFF
jgi:uncharacterized phiE125 gp8 family phage protein